MSAPRSILVVLVFVVTAACAAHAQVEATLPFGGYFRAGQYMPVHLRATKGGSLRDVTLGGEGLLPTTVTSGGGEIVVPVLVTRATARELIVTSANDVGPIRLPVRELPAGRQMVGVIREAAGELERFVPPAPTVVKVALDRALVRAAPPVALEMLHALVMDDAAATIDDVSEWSAAGVTLLLARDDAPDDQWPWVAFDGGCLLRVAPVGPRAAVVGEDANLPALSWSPGASAPVRRHVVLAGALFGIVATACALLPRRTIALVSLAAVTLTAGVAIFAWQHARSPLHQLAGQIVVDHRPVAQWDRWTYFASRESVEASAPFLGADRPMLVDAAQVEAVRLRLHWSEDESRRYFAFALDAGAKIGFLSRVVRPQMVDWNSEPPSASNPFAPLARKLYVDENYAVAGQIGSSEGQLIVIVRQP